MTFKIVIPRWHPTRINQLLSRHWMTRSRLKRVDANMIAAYVLQGRFPVAYGPREVSLLITLGPKQRAPDPDAFWKSTLDALVKSRMLIDDNRRYAKLGTVEFDRASERATTISLTELGS